MKKFFSVSLAICFVLTSVGQALAGSFTPLGELPGGAFQSQAFGISGNGQVAVGVDNNAEVNANGRPEAARWTSGPGWQGLGFVDPTNPQRTGQANGASGDGSVVAGTSNSRAFRWQNNIMTNLGSLAGGNNSEANGISRDGTTVVGRSDSSSGSQAFRWQNGVMTGLGDLPGGAFNSAAFDTSQDGSVVVGNSISNGGPNGAVGSEAFRWQNNVMTGLGDLAGGSFFSQALGVSPNGEFIVGQSASASGNEAYIWKQSTGMMEGLGSGGGFNGRAWDVNDNGRRVVGDAFFGGNSRAIVWDDEMEGRLLKEILEQDCGLSLTGWTLLTARGISDDGAAIAGWGINPDGMTEAYIANIGAVSPAVAPIPVPGAAWLLCAGLAGLAGLRRRKR